MPRTKFLLDPLDRAGRSRILEPNARTRWNHNRIFRARHQTANIVTLRGAPTFFIFRNLRRLPTDHLDRGSPNGIRHIEVALRAARDIAIYVTILNLNTRAIKRRLGRCCEGCVFCDETSNKIMEVDAAAADILERGRRHEPLARRVLDRIVPDDLA